MTSIITTSRCQRGDAAPFRIESYLIFVLTRRHPFVFPHPSIFPHSKRRWTNFCSTQSLKGPQKGRIITIGTSELQHFSPGGKAVEVLLSRANRTSGGRDLSWMKTEPPGGKHLLRPREELGKSPNSDAWWLYHTRLSHSYCLFCSEKKCGTWELWLSCLVTHREKCCNPKRGFYSSLQVLHQSA